MGAWGNGIFEDDSAYDFEEEIMSDPKGFFRNSFDTALSAGYLECDECHAVTVSAAYMDNLLNGTQYRTDLDGYEDERNVNMFRILHGDMVVEELKPLAVAALDKVLSEDSELNELWSDNVELYPGWRTNIEGLRDRLK